MKDLTPLVPELFLLTMTCVILLVDVVLTDKKRLVTYILSQMALLSTIVLISNSFGAPGTLFFSDTFIVDDLSRFLKISLLICVGTVLMYSRHYINQREFERGEYYLLALFSTLGMMVLVSAHHFISLYLGLELLALPIYALVAMRRKDAQCAEAGMKYFVLGALASGMLLYGMSMLYGATGSLSLSVIAETLITLEQNKMIALLGMVFVIIGIGFKLGLVPFHMWVPDIYQGAPTSVTAFISTAPKIAAFAMLFRLLEQAMPYYHVQWQELLMVMGILSMTIGNFAALVQTNIKRMLAYSAIAHMGYFILGMVPGTESGNSAALFYMISYAIMALAAFGILLNLSGHAQEVDLIDDLQGLLKRSPLLAVAMILVMASMAGLPPMIGFWSKVEIINSVIDADMVWLAIAIVVYSIIGLFYYLRIIKVMCFDEPQTTSSLELVWDSRMALKLNMLLLLAFSFVPGWLMSYCLQLFA